MGRCDEFQRERFEQFQRFQYMFTERTHDMRIVVLERKTKIADLVVEQSRVAEMAAEYIAAEQNVPFLDQRALCIRNPGKGC